MSKTIGIQVKHTGYDLRSGTVATALDPGVFASAERFLTGRKRDLCLKGALLDLYREQSWHRRSVIVRSWMVWVSAISMSVTLLSFILVPSQIFWSMFVCSFLVPLLNIATLLAWRHRRSASYEGLSIVVWMGLFVGFSAGLGSTEGGIVQERYLAGAPFRCLHRHHCPWHRTDLDESCRRSSNRCRMCLQSL